jgi:hypothetical protein
MRIQVEISFKNQMENMSRDKVEHYYLLTIAFLMPDMSSSSFNKWNTTWNPPWLLSTLHQGTKMTS